MNRSLIMMVAGLLLLSVSCTRRPPPQAPPPSTPPPAAEPPTDSDPALAPRLELRAEPSRVKPGESATLVWESRNADRVSIDHGIGDVGTAGRIKIFPDQTTTYEVAAAGVAGEVRQSVTIEVLSEPGDIVEEELAALPLAERFSYFVKPVFFDYDSALLTDQAILTLDENIRWLALPVNSEISILLQGHADERGTDEYNLALADKRAQVVRKYMSEHGINQVRIATVSLGEDSPFDPGQTEEAFALNRRVQFVLNSAPGQR